LLEMMNEALMGYLHLNFRKKAAIDRWQMIIITEKTALANRKTKKSENNINSSLPIASQ